VTVTIVYQGELEHRDSAVRASSPVHEMVVRAAIGAVG
jgi:hypothetical protein